MNLTPEQSALLDRIVTRGEGWITEDVRVGHVPREAPDFAALHDYRDANLYVLNAEGAFDPEVVAHFVVDLGDGEVDNDAMWSFYGMAQDRLDAWVKTGALRAVVLKPGALATLQREAEERAIRNAPYPYLAG